jgi:NADPH:quinone reductase-like Zn-dependent oxidoreductase
MTMPTMKAVRIHAYGAPDEVMRLDDAPLPEPGPGEVLIKVRAAGSNPVDWAVVRGYTAGWLESDFPITPGWDVSGVVAALGPGAEGFAVGDEVYGMPRFPAWGRTYAEYTTAPASDLAHKPRRLDHVHAASVPLAALTAWQALTEYIRLAPGQAILITGASGGVGHFAVQIAKALGAHVIATASARNAEFVRALGADHFVDYTAGPFETVVHEQDAVLNTVGGDTLARSYATLKRGGVLATITGGLAPEHAERHGVTAHRLLVEPNGAHLAHLAQLIDDGKISPFVEAVFPLADAAQLHLQGETQRTRGKLVLAV